MADDLDDAAFSSNYGDAEALADAQKSCDRAPRICDLALTTKTHIHF
jgi:hypothetical protein